VTEGSKLPGSLGAGSKDWLFGFLLHNVECKRSFEQEFVAIVPNQDPRVQEIVSSSDIGKQLIGNFTDQRGLPVRPSVLILREDAPAKIFKEEALVAFRNLYAISCLTWGWQHTIGGNYPASPLYSDFFDFHPTVLGKDRNTISTLSPALQSFGSPNRFVGQISPHLPHSDLFVFEPDVLLVQPLLKAWEQRYIRNRQNWKTRVLFRSLEMAYQAGSVPAWNASSIYDWGSKVGLWVSALEVLSHPRTGKSGFDTVVDLFATAKWRSQHLRQTNFTVRVNKKPRPANLVTKLCSELYAARNDFLHGNPVRHSRLFPFKNTRRPPLPHFGPLLYKVALTCFLGVWRRTPWQDDDIEGFVKFADWDALEEGLLTALRPRKRLPVPKALP
jgi:hypothetical protein